MLNRVRSGGTLCALCLSAALSLSLITVARGQDAKEKPNEPAPASAVYYLNASAQLIPLESEIARIKHDYRDLGFVGGTTVYQVAGRTSPVILHANNKPEFVIRFDTNSDPLEAMQFYRFDSVGSSRVVPIADFNPLGEVSNVTANINIVDFNAERYGLSSFRVVPEQPLAPGEYCLIAEGSTQMKSKSPASCFAVEADSNQDGSTAVDSTSQRKTLDPEYFSVFYYISPAGDLAELERQLPRPALRDSREFLQVAGEKSPIRLGADSKMEFVIRVSEDPASAKASVQFYRFEAQNGMRQISLKKTQSIAVSAEKYSDSSLKLVPTSKLAPGEYCFSRTRIIQGFCFGVDAAGSTAGLP
jgi:hypothetical protein